MMYIFRDDLKERKEPFINVPHKQTMMCLNESTLNPLEIIQKRFNEKLSTLKLNRYFSPITEQLYQALVNYIGYNVEKEQIIFGNGADDMIYNILLSVRAENGFALSLSPSYFDYKTYASAVDFKIKFQQFNKDYSFDSERLIETANLKDCKILILCNPNNPTGHLMSDDEIFTILDSVKETPILLDETYFEFSNKTFVQYLDKYPNLILVRSFSKAFSSAGLRFGYLISAKNNRSQIKKCMQFFNTSLLVQAFALSILEEKDSFIEHNQNVIKMRNKLKENLSKYKQLEVYNSDTNFLIFSYGEKTQELFDYISNHDVAIRNVSKESNFTNKLRVTVGSKEENKLFLNLIKSFFASDNS